MYSIIEIYLTVICINSYATVTSISMQTSRTCMYDMNHCIVPYYKCWHESVFINLLHVSLRMFTHRPYLVQLCIFCWVFLQLTDPCYRYVRFRFSHCSDRKVASPPCQEFDIFSTIPCNNNIYYSKLAGVNVASVLTSLQMSVSNWWAISSELYAAYYTASSCKRVGELVMVCMQLSSARGIYIFM